jgi:hypothetical protein
MNFNVEYTRKTTTTNICSIFGHKHLIIDEGNPIFNPIGSNILGRK